MLSSSISESVPQTLIRTGSDGRLRFTRQQRDALVDAFEASGVSAMAFAKEHGVNYQTFVSWVRKPRGRRKPRRAPADNDKVIVVVVS